MNMGIGTGRARTTLAVAALLATVVLGIGLRLVDPLSSPVIPAEDPYTHMAIVREHLRTGELEPLTVGAGLYPPGLHSFLAAVWVFTGADLYEIIRLGPVFFGAIGILGMALLLWRHVGPVGALVGSLGYAVAPEVIFRTTMMSPTAQDLALLPFFLYALLEVTAGRLRWAAVAAPMSLFLVFAHPWLLGILAMMGVGFIALSYLLPFAASAGERVTPVGIATAIAIVGVGLGLTFTSCNKKCGPGWTDLFPALAGYSWLAWLFVLLSFAPLVILYNLRKTKAEKLLSIKRERPVWWPVRVAASFAIAGLLGWATQVAFQQGMPPHVNLPRMIGWPILGLAAFAMIMIPFLPGRLSHLAAGLFAATYPFVIFNPLNSPYWSHRTAAFLAVSLMMLAGIAAAAITRWTANAISAKSSNPTVGARRRYAGVVAGFLVAIACAGTVYAGTPDGYEGGWYRLYPECELEGLRGIAAVADANPAAVIIVGGWQPKLVLSALTDDSYRIWYATAFYTDADKREEIVVNLAHQGRPVIVVIDRYLITDFPDSTGFVQGDDWQPIGSWCANQGTGQPRLLAYQTVSG